MLYIFLVCCDLTIFWLVQNMDSISQYLPRAVSKSVKSIKPCPLNLLLALKKNGLLALIIHTVVLSYLSYLYYIVSHRDSTHWNGHPYKSNKLNIAVRKGSYIKGKRMRNSSNYAPHLPMHPCRIWEYIYIAIAVPLRLI